MIGAQSGGERLSLIQESGNFFSLSFAFAFALSLSLSISFAFAFAFAIAFAGRQQHGRCMNLAWLTLKQRWDRASYRASYRASLSLGVRKRPKQRFVQPVSSRRVLRGSRGA